MQASWALAVVAGFGVIALGLRARRFGFGTYRGGDPLAIGRTMICFVGLVSVFLGVLGFFGFLDLHH